MGFDPFLVGYVLALLYLPPVILIFEETIHTKFFVSFMVLSLSQFNFLFFLFLEELTFQTMIVYWILAGQLLEVLCIPLIRKYITPHVKNILEVLNQQNPGFALFPFFSFLLLAFYGIQRKYVLADFIPLLLSTVVIFFAYYLIAVSIEQTKRHQQMERLSMTDDLTGLCNRRYIEQKIEEAYDVFQRTQSELTLIIADIDYFKTYNDKYGHACGDYLLKAVAGDIQASVRVEDWVARWGGDEFLLVLPATDEEKAVKLAERIKETVEKRQYVYEGILLSVTLTLGVSVMHGEYDTVDSIIKQADTLMYEGKRAGRNRIIFSHMVQ
jgi:diguanylate cyclase (GGDEF)-like protein